MSYWPSDWWQVVDDGSFHQLMQSRKNTTALSPFTDQSVGAGTELQVATLKEDQVSLLC